MSANLEKEMQDAIWAAGSLFERGKTSGSSANISFRIENRIYISRSGSCFARLTSEDFAVVEITGDGLKTVSEKKPSKELPLHWYLYRADNNVGAVIHTHSFYSALWSCLKHEDTQDILPDYTPYLKMKVGTVGLVPYGPPGSEELFQAFEKCVGKSGGYLLKNHGPVVGGKDTMDAFYKIEEMEESARIAWHLRTVKEEDRSMISTEPGMNQEP